MCDVCIYTTVTGDTDHNLLLLKGTQGSAHGVSLPEHGAWWMALPRHQQQLQQQQRRAPRPRPLLPALRQPRAPLSAAACAAAWSRPLPLLLLRPRCRS
jgi:hypothetical protein